MRTTVDDAQTGYRTPGAIILLVLGAVVWYVYKEYRKFMKDNYL